MGKRALHFIAATPHILLGGGDRNVGIFLERAARFIHDPVAAADLPGHDGTAGFFATLEEPARNKEQVETKFGHAAMGRQAGEKTQLLAARHTFLNREASPIL